MAEKSKNKGVHTSPETAGKRNMSKATIEQKVTDEDGTLRKMIPIMNHGIALGYSGLWTNKMLSGSIGEFFDYCSDIMLKPTMPLLRLWLNVEQSTLLEWKNNPNKHPEKTKIIKMAFNIMEAILQERAEKYPTANIFLMKTSHGHIETSKVEFNNSSQIQIGESEIKDTVEKLGLGSKKLQLVEN